MDKEFDAAMIRPASAVVSLLICAAAFVLFGYYAWGSLAMLGLLGALGGSVAAFGIVVGGRGRVEGRFSVRMLLGGACGLAVFALALLSIPGFQRVGIEFRDRWFLRHLPDFEKEAVAIEKQIPNGANVEGRVDRSFPLAPYVQSFRDRDGVATIVFTTHAGGIPADHFGYMYRSDDRPLADRDYFSIRQRMAPHWFALNSN